MHVFTTGVTPFAAMPTLKTTITVQPVTPTRFGYTLNIQLPNGLSLLELTTPAHYPTRPAAYTAARQVAAVIRSFLAKSLSLPTYYLYDKQQGPIHNPQGLLITFPTHQKAIRHAKHLVRSGTFETLPDVRYLDSQGQTRSPDDD